MEKKWYQNGSSVSLSENGTTIAIGALPTYEEGQERLSYVRVYKYKSNPIPTLGQWKQVGSEIQGKAAADGCGAAISLRRCSSSIEIGV